MFFEFDGLEDFLDLLFVGEYLLVDGVHLTSVFLQLILMNLNNLL